jgi:predicted GIY-YIG superfamily endonuclease
MTKPNKQIRMARAAKAKEPSNQTLYRFFNANNELLYIGITSNPFSRMAGHSLDKHWFTEVTHATFEHFLSRAAVDAAETRAIRAEFPKYNKAKVLGYQRSPDHMKSIRFGKVKKHDLLLTFIEEDRYRTFGSDLQYDSWLVIKSIKRAKESGHECEACDAILVHKTFSRHYRTLDKLM